MIKCDMIFNNRVILYLLNLFARYLYKCPNKLYIFIMYNLLIHSI